MDSGTNDPIRIGIDIGGTFTDFIVYSPTTRKINTYKVLSTPENPARAVIEGLHQLQVPDVVQIIHGSTVATNALLERKGAKTALITTKGFKDILIIGRQNRPSLYDWTSPQPIPLIPADLSFEVQERIDSDGNILIPLDENALQPLLDLLFKKCVKSVAVSLLFSFLYPQHELAIARLFRSADMFVSTSSEILPEFREFERTSTTAVNAYVTPILDKYLSALSSELPATQLQVMQSNGGMISIDHARQSGVRCILSGPAGGIVGAQCVAERAQKKSDHEEEEKNLRLITFDMGGTSTDVSLIDQTPRISYEATIGGYPISIPMMDIHTIGAGGGSIAYIDHGGALRVGPNSAGADPGPACYGKSELPTVTDANLVLGRLIPEFFLGGTFPIYPQRAWNSIERLGKQLGVNTVQCALGIITVANAHMERALRVISVERGYDPHDFTLFSFGGAGGVHAAELARSLNIPHVLISPYASVLSALGMLMADIAKDYVQTVMLRDNCSLDLINKNFQLLIEQGYSDILSQGISPPDIVVQKFIDARYRGQSYELTIPFTPGWQENFHQAHQKAFGYMSTETEVELVNIRVKAIGKTTQPVMEEYPNGDRNPQRALIGTRNVKFSDTTRATPFYRHELLQPENQITGPAVIIRPDTTVLIGTQDILSVDSFLNLWVTIGS